MQGTLKERPERVQQDLERRMEDNTSPLTLCGADGRDRGPRHPRAAKRARGIPTLVVHGLEDSLVRRTAGASSPR